jgi:CyaY protein
MNAPAVFRVLEGTAGLLRRWMEFIPEEDVQWRPGPDRWSIAMVVAHLADVEEKRQRTLEWLKVLPEGVRSRTGRHEELGVITEDRGVSELLSGQPMMDERMFQKAADEALESVRRALEEAAEQGGFEVDYQAGTLTIEFEETGRPKFVISPQTPVRQMWVSALAKSFKLEWDESQRAFVWRETGETLAALVRRLVEQG